MGNFFGKYFFTNFAFYFFEFSNFFMIKVLFYFYLGPPTAVPRTNATSANSNFKRQNTVDSATIKVNKYCCTLQ